MVCNVRIRLWLIVLCIIPVKIAGAVLPYLNFRSVSVNAARELVGWQNQINKACMNTSYGSFSITPEYERSFNARAIAQALLCGSLYERTCSTPNLAFKVQGTKVTNRDPHAWLADYFYLPTDFSSIINIDPKIDTFLVDFNIYVGFDTWLPGLFLRAHAPMTNTRWDLKFCESNIIAGTNGYDPGYFSDSYTTNTNRGIIVGVNRTDLLKNFTQFIFGQDSITDNPTINFEPLHNARMSTFRLTKSRLAEIQLALGYNFLLDPDYHLGLELRGYIPIGNEPRGEFIFESIVGNGHHAEAGLGITSHWGFWNDTEQQRGLSLYLDANITHMFTSCQRRTFDLRGKPLSRYMLAADMRPPAKNLLIDINGVHVIPTGQFKYKFTPVANLTTIPVKVSCAIQADIACKLAFTGGNFEWDIGYDFWYRSCEKISKASDCCCLNNLAQGWALKGDSFVFGFTQNGTTDQIGIPLATSQSQATIFNGTNNWPHGLDGFAWNQNPGIDIPKGPAFDTGGSPLFTHDLILSDPWNQVLASKEPVVITADDLDIEGARNKGLSNKIFTHLNYTFSTCSTWVPYFGIGGEVEFGHNTTDRACIRPPHPCHPSQEQLADNCSTPRPQSRCRSCSLSQWGIWIKGGLTFAGKKN